EGFHSAWVNTIVRHLNGSILPPQYRAVPQVHLGAWVEADVASFEKHGNHNAAPAQGAGIATGACAAPQPVQTFVVDFFDQDVYEVRVFDERRGLRLAGVVEIVSPGNKDRSEKIKAFTTKCVSYLAERVGLIVADVVTTRRVNFYKTLSDLLSLEDAEGTAADLYAVAFRTRAENSHVELDTWPAALQVGQQLPTLPLWLTDDFSVPLDLEKSYEETCQVLRIR